MFTKQTLLKQSFLNFFDKFKQKNSVVHLSILAFFFIDPYHFISAREPVGVITKHFLPWMHFS
jgi:hypothetical protein